MSSVVEKEEVINYGDHVILYLGFNNTQPLFVEKGGIEQTRFGAIKHDKLVGEKFGSKINLTKGFIYILPLSPELWTISLKHRTQILYSTDISFVIFQLDLKPGAVVIESGTGSGSMSHSLLRTILPNGHLHTFDFHSNRAEQAAMEFESHGFSKDEVTVYTRDVCQNGFFSQPSAHAIFLDLPKPWLAVPHAKNSLFQGGRLCSFSPCIEQVQRTCGALRMEGFVEVESFEVILCPMEVKEVSMPLADLGFQFQKVETKYKSEQEVDEISEENDITNDQIFKKFHQSNRPRVGEFRRGEKRKKGNMKENNEKSSKKVFFNFKSSVPCQTRPGHTGYLTFATLYPTTTNS